MLWPAQHEDDKECRNCPSCIILPALQKLNKLASHASFLQVDEDPDRVDGESRKKKLEKDLAFSQVAIPKHLLKFMPGKSYIRETSIFDDHCLLSGKMKTLSYFLRKVRICCNHTIALEWCSSQNSKLFPILLSLV